MIARSFVTAAALAAIAVAPAVAQTQQTAPAQQRATVVRDAATGKLRAPTAEEAAELAATPAPAGARSARRAAPSVVRHPDGSISMEVDESLMMYSVARRNPDGSIGTQCVTGEKAAQSLVRKTAPRTLVSKAAKEGGLELK